MSEISNQNSIKTDGRFWIYNALVDEHLKLISGNEIKVLLAVTRHYNRDGTCFPSVSRIARLSGINSGTASKCLHSLAKLGYLRIDCEKRGYKLLYTYTNTTRLLFPKWSKPSEKLPQITMPKEVTKELIKEEINQINDKPKSFKEILAQKAPQILANLENKKIAR